MGFVRLAIGQSFFRSNTVSAGTSKRAVRNRIQPPRASILYAKRSTNLAGFLESDLARSLDLPQDDCFLAVAKSMESTMRKAILRQRPTPNNS